MEGKYQFFFLLDFLPGEASVRNGDLSLSGDPKAMVMVALIWLLLMLIEEVALLLLLLSLLDPGLGLGTGVGDLPREGDDKDVVASEAFTL